ncbi:MAG: hypothetical protein FWD53_09310, partial [Phycisphaerales bacterium]|nr:hypothetical protein [Phycisphaerales bacterium]
MSLSIPPSPPILDLYGTPPAVLHRPRLAALACLLLAVAAVVEVFNAVLFLVFAMVPIDNWMNACIYVVFVFTSVSLVVAGAVVLCIADLARHASPRVSPWPRRLILMLAVLYAVGHYIYALGVLSYYFTVSSSFDFFNFYLPALIVALGTSVGLYIVGLLYALPVAAVL